VSFLRRAFEQRDLVPNTFGGAAGVFGTGPIPSNSAGWENTSGVSVTDSSALGLTAFYACVRLLADSIASLPWDAYRKSDGDAVRRQVSPTPSLLRAPSDGMTPFDWKHMMVVSLVMRGNFYGLVTERDGLEYPTSITPLHPDQVRIDRDPKTYARRTWVGNQILTNPKDLFHVRAFSLPGSDTGLSPIAMARHSLGLGLAAQEYGSKWFRDGASPSSVLEAANDLTPEQALALQQSWISSHGGRRRPAVLSGVTWKPITITPEESQFLQTRQHQGLEIAQMMGVPPHMIGIMEKSTSWGTGIEQQSIGFVTYTLRPWLTRIEAAMSDILPRGQFLKFSVDALLRGDIKSRYEAYRTAIEGGWQNPDEVRALEDQAPIPGGAGAKFRQPLNFGPLGYEPPEPAAPTAPPTAPPQQEDPNAPA
jgi:HK97 family phage portal protein